MSALLVLIIGCVGLVALSFGIFQKLVSANWWMNHTLEVITEGEESFVCLLDCETAYRGYLLTGNDSFLEPYDVCHAHVMGHLRRMQELTTDNPRQRELMPEIIRLADEKVKFSTETIKWRKVHPGAAITNAVQLERGKAIMDEFRRKINATLDEETNLLKLRRGEVERWRMAVYAAIAICGSVILSGAIWIVSSSRHYVAEQARIRRELSFAKDEAVKANILKSQFVANISHEIRTPMSGILGLSELLTNYQMPEDQKEITHHIFTSAQNLLALLNELLDFSRLEAGRLEIHKQPFQLDTVINEVMASVKVQADSKQLDLSCNVLQGASGLKISGDPDRLRQILLNLMHNAVKFTAQGSVQLVVMLDKEEGKNIFLRFEVADTGIGIKAQNKQKLFEPFVQGDGSTTRQYGGTGLGLSICKSLVHLMHGTIDCQSNAAGGATFSFVVPFENVSDMPD
jgi:signal transduction histidine kinase